jgi:hypothetical protein
MRLFPLFRTGSLWIIVDAGSLSDKSIPDGISSLNVGIAGFNFSVHCSDAPLANEPQRATYTPFITKGPAGNAKSLTVDVRLEIGDFPPSGGLEKIFEGNGSWSMFKKKGEYYLSLNPSKADAECIICFSMPLEKAVVYCGKMDVLEEDGRRTVRNPFTYPLDQLLLMYALADGDGALIHAAGVDCQSRGYLFPGISGAGKSTLSRSLASRGYEVLSDDRIAVRRIDDSFRIFGTPWAGDAGIARNKDLSLDGIFFIRHGTEHSIKALSPTEMVERLMPVTSIPWFDGKILLSILSFCENIASVPAYELSFKPDIGVVDLFEKFVSKYAEV